MRLDRFCASFHRLILLLGMLLLAACAQATVPSPNTLTDLHDIQTLRDGFNQDAGKPRLILLAAPT